MSSTPNEGYYEKDSGGYSTRDYDSGTKEWRYDRGHGWTKWEDDQKNTGWERDHGNGWIERTDDSGNKSLGQDRGDGWTKWDDGTWTQKR